MTAILASAAISQAAITVTIEEIGSNVKASYTGTLITTGMGFSGNSTLDLKQITPDTGTFAAYISDDSLVSSFSVPPYFNTPWNIVPTAFGAGELKDADSFSINSGNSFAFTPTRVTLASSFSSGDSLSGSITFENETLQTLGITPGNYNAEFGSGDTLTINAIPEPSSYGFLLGAAGLATAIFCRRRRRPSAA